ncbi:MAG: hypothetical protein J7M08_02975 [Planctomycetes bacterium]|nr:hypothetical protein [Planctomycetota bacterium]
MTRRMNFKSNDRSLDGSPHFTFIPHNPHFILAAFAALALFVGCVASSPQAQGRHLQSNAFSKVTIGMPADQVRDLLGEPEMIVRDGTDQHMESWYYADGAAVLLNEDKVRFKGMAAGPAGLVGPSDKGRMAP